jgi:biopolymer transport protein ExbB/TolQ
MSRDHYSPFYGWLLIVGVTAFGAYLLWTFGLFSKLLTEDVTYLSSIILVLFFFITLYLGFAAWQLSRQASHAYFWSVKASSTFSGSSSGSSKKVSKSWAGEHLTLLQWQRVQSTHESESLLARLVERIHRGHTSGWFFSDILMRLGLIGTVIGFVLMLSTVYQLKDNDIQALQQLLGTMGRGMQVALYTTLSGLGTAMLVSIQCQWLDRCADNLVSQIIELGMQDQVSD